MNLELITEEDYHRASLRLMKIFHAEPNSSEYDELSVLITSIDNYEEENFQKELISEN